VPDDIRAELWHGYLEAIAPLRAARRELRGRDEGFADGVRIPQLVAVG
jgi:hypothetical protein